MFYGATTKIIYENIPFTLFLLNSKININSIFIIILVLMRNNLLCYSYKIKLLRYFLVVSN